MSWRHDKGISRHAKPQNFSLSSGLSQEAAGIYVSSKRRTGTSLAVQWLRFFTLNARGPGSVSGQGSRSQTLQLRVSMLQLKIPDFPGGLVVNNTPPPIYAGTTGDWGSSPGLGRCPGRENGNPFWYSYWANPMDRGTWRATVLGWGWGSHKELDMTEWLHEDTLKVKIPHDARKMENSECCN